VHSSLASGRHRPPRPADIQSFLRSFEVQSLDGSANNRNHSSWGQAGTAYTRVGAARYADGRSAPVTGPDPRYVSNRIFNDTNQNVFSEHRASQWVFAWGQFVDHTIGLRAEGAEKADLPFSATDPLESFTNDLGVIPFTRSKATPGTGVTNPRQQTNTVSSYMDAWAVYGGTNERLEWLREGSVDGDLKNNGAKLLLPDGYLPRSDARGDSSTAPTMALDGRLLGQPSHAMVAGDVRANENIALTAVQTLFAREHNRIVALLPETLSEEERFQIARRVVIAEEQYITYTQFLPAMGVRLPAYQGYNPRVNATITNEFATVGYRAHSQIHGDMEAEVSASDMTEARIQALRAQGIEVEATEEDPEELEVTVPMNVMFFNPDLVPAIGLGPLLAGLGAESQYNNDEMIDNQLRSVLFQIPTEANPDCLDGPEMTECFQGVVDLGALDVARGRDHGMPTYNQMRRAYGLRAKSSFSDITGERSQNFRRGSTPASGGIDDPKSLEFTELRDIDGEAIEAGSEEAITSVTRAVRRTPLAARLRALYGSVDRIDAFVGMSAERHGRSAELGELQQAMWAKQFAALRDGDRFFYGTDPGLSLIKRQFGIDFRVSLGDVIAANTGVDRDDLSEDVFIAPVPVGVA